MACDSLIVDDKTVAKLSTDLLQVDCQNLLSTGLLQVVSTSCNKSANDKLQKVTILRKDNLALIFFLAGVVNALAGVLLNFSCLAD